VTPRDEIYTLLFERLGLKPNNEIHNEENLVYFQKLCESWFDSLLNQAENDMLTEKLIEIERIKNLYSESDYNILIEIFKIKYYIQLNKVNDALKQVSNLFSISSKFTIEQRYYWTKFRGDLFSLRHEHEKALELLMTCLNHINFSSSNEDTIANLYYDIGSESCSLRQLSNAIYYIEKALSYYQQKYRDYDCAKCHMIIGMSHMFLNNVELALENYDTAAELGIRCGNDEVVGAAYFEIGYIHWKENNFADSIHFYELSIETRNINYEIASSMLGIARVHMSKQDIEKAHSIIEKALPLVEDTSKKENKYVYLRLNVLQCMIHNDYNKLEKILKDELIPFIESINDYVNLGYYSELLVNILSEKHLYKQALHYQKIASSAYKKISNI